MSARDDAVSAATAAYGDGGYGHAHRMNKAIAAYEAALSAAGLVVVPRAPLEKWCKAVTTMRAAQDKAEDGRIWSGYYVRVLLAENDLLAAAFPAAPQEDK